MNSSHLGKVFSLLAVGTIVFLVLRGSPERAAASNETQRIFLKIVNEVAMPAQFIQSTTRTQVQGVSTADSNGCQLAIRRPPNGAGSEAAIKRVELELRMSPLASDIRRFNSPKTLADLELFQVDDNCNPLSYLSSAPRFRPPLQVRAIPFAMGYEHSARKQGAEVFWQGISGNVKSFPLTNDVANNDFEVTRPPASGIGRRVRVLVNGMPIAEWRRDVEGISFLSNAQPIDGYSLRIKDGRSSVRLSAGESIGFPENVTAIVVKVDKLFDGRKRRDRIQEVARFSWKKTTTAPLFQQDDKGRALWARQPTSFEVQVSNATRLSGANIADRVALSWRPELNDSLQEVLDREAELMFSNRYRTSTGSHIPRRVYGSIVMMDGLNGEVLGFASWPHAETPPRVRIVVASIDQPWGRR